MKKLADKKIGEWSTPRVHGLIKRDFKRRFKQRITTPDINKIWASYIEGEILNKLFVGSVVNLDTQSRIWVKARLRSEDKKAMALLNKGLMYSGGRVVEAKLNLSTTEYIYDIVFETKRYKHKKKIFFQPHADLSKVVSEGILKGKLITRTYVD